MVSTKCLLLSLLLSCLLLPGQAWWPWGEEGEGEGAAGEEGFKEQLEKDLAGRAEDTVVVMEEPEIVVKKESPVPDLKEQRKEARKEAKRELKKDIPLNKKDEAKIDAMLATPELAMKLDKESFEKKLDEVIAAHETLHRGKEVHFNDHGDHNEAFDHEAFLGDEAEEFKNLTPEEGAVKLAIVVDKIDADHDNVITEEELTIWIKETAIRSVERRTDEFWGRSNPGGGQEISWDQYRAIQYGFLSDQHITDESGRWKEEEDVDPETLKIYNDLELRDRRRWTVADRNKNLWLSKEEFAAFIHPEHAEHMGDILTSETMADFDQDGDGKLDLAEYVKSIFGDTKEVADWDNGGVQFRSWRDTDHDGYIDRAELRAWMMPEDYDPDRAEAQHLIHEADRNGDSVLSKAEVLDSQGHFVASQATDFGADLHYHHDEL